VKPIDFHPDAADEAREAADRYEAIQPGLGSDFRVELDAALARVRSNPQLYAAEVGAIRFAPLHRFPYSVIYEELADRIWVAAIGHHSRRPGYWARRRPNS
jgi:ParE toxin of type II toxin-antitoxin system, parDE